MNNVMMPKIAGMLEEITGLRFKEKKAAAFGSYGWNGGAVDRIHTRLTDAGFETTESIKTKWRPDGKAMRECKAYGQKIAKQWALTALNVTPIEFNTVSSEEDKPASELPHDSDCQCMICTVCNWVYDPVQGEPNQGVEPGTAWDDVPDYFLCPECNLGKDVFVPHSKEDVA
jgi:anaerobic nitric oxide reductase flavorubredoxin